MTSLFLLAQAAAPGPMALIYQFAPIAAIMLLFYFLLVAPMRKRQRSLQQQVDALQKGDKVVTNGGLHGEVAGIEGAVVLVKIADQVKVRVSKSAISQVEDRGTNP
jgi:preprotein translocase subunit YajC